MRVMISSNGYFVNSGYGIQCRSLMPRLAELPEFGGSIGSLEGRKNVAQFAWFGNQAAIQTVDGFTIYPAGNDPYGNDVIGRHVRHHGSSICIYLIDAWVLRDVAKSISPSLFLPWFPVDHDPIPSRVLDGIAGAHMPLTYSKWGRDMCNAIGVENTYIPHGVEPSIYHVIDRETAKEFKRQITGLDDCHLTIMVAANKGYPDRKAFTTQLPAWAMFAKDKPHARLYIHTEPSPMYGGVDFGALIADLGIQDKVIFPDRYENFLGMPQQYLALVYNAGDVLMGAAMSEGFGIPLVEAQACGTPVITTDFSAMPELVRWGVAVEPLTRIWTPMNAWQVLPDPRQIRTALEVYHQLWLDNGHDLPLAKRIETQNAIHAEYDWDIIVRDQWAPLMTRLADEAPPLDERFRVGGVEVPKAQDDSVAGFVDALNEGVAAEKKPRPKKRVAPLVPPSEREAVRQHFDSVTERATKRKAAHDAVDAALDEVAE